MNITIEKRHRDMMQLHAMETRSAKRKKIAQIEQEQENNAKSKPLLIDRISDLPDDIIHQILLLLPIKCVAQMSVLSKRWKFLWTSFPDLDFTTLDPFPLISTKNHKKIDISRHPLSSSKLDFITQVLSIRDVKHKDIRVLCFRASLSFSRLNNLVRSAIRHNVRELDIEVHTEVDTEDFFNFPRCVIGSESLRVLKLKSGFRLPPSSVMRNGFQSLHTLSLSLVILYNQPSLSDLFSESSFPLLKNLHLDMCFGLTHLRIGCRALEDLNLERCYELQGLEICGGKIERMRVISCFDAYCDNNTWVRLNVPKLENLIWKFNAVTDVTVFENSNLLNEASIGFFMLSEGKVNMGRFESANNFFSGLSHAHSLTLNSQTIEVMFMCFNVFNV